MINRAGWAIFFMIALLTSLILVPIEAWIRLWPAGFIGMAAVYAIDKTFIELGAFQYTYGNKSLSGLPAFYWISSFPAGIILIHFFPQVALWQFPYILLMALILLIIEYIMFRLGYFHYLKWDPIKSCFLNFACFTVVIWLAQWIGLTG